MGVDGKIEHSWAHKNTGKIMIPEFQHPREHPRLEKPYKSLTSDAALQRSKPAENKPPPMRVLRGCLSTLRKRQMIAAAAFNSLTSVHHGIAPPQFAV